MFLLVSCNGGLTQQRAAIINSVALARFLNFTLILPFFSENPVWQDSRCRILVSMRMSMHKRWELEVVLSEVTICREGLRAAVCLPFPVCSQFSDLYDLPHFEEALRGIVELATRVPKPHTKLRIRAPSNESATLDWFVFAGKEILHKNAYTGGSFPRMAGFATTLCCPISLQVLQERADADCGA